MSELSIEQFPDFFRSLYGNDREPFPWQTMLMKRVVEKGWPDLLDLPTASGKTACIDVAVFALALQSHLDWQHRTTPRRVFFVVDRRIVVDEAAERARHIARALLRGERSILRAVAARLQHLSRTDLPLATARLRGGVVPDDGWANIATQPAIITGTVDQVGSRLLFRSYGCSSLIAPIHAALVAHDSLIILDEAHCARPFRQTASAVCEYLDPRQWTTDHRAIAPPLRLMIMTATPPPGVAKDPFPVSEAERERALDHPKLRERRDAEKPAKLELTKNKDFVRKAGEAIHSLLRDPNLRRIAVMVNRVQTARDIADSLNTSLNDASQIELLTGQLRPIDRDELIGRLHDQLKSGSTTPLDKPVILVTTQCLEVGADFDFDGIVTECASLDALLQRFGRLDRLGTRKVSKAVILAREPDVAADVDDFIYGKALKETWWWLKSIEAGGVVDFGIGAMYAHKRALDDAALSAMLAPASDAPVLMPAHVDLLCQTAPRPDPDPDVSVFLHGLERARPEVSVAFRADLPADQPPTDDDDIRGQWVEAIQLAPPLPSECLTIPLHRFRSILRGNLNEPDADVEAAKTDEETADFFATVHFVVWRYRDSFVTNDPHLVRPGDTLIFPGDAKLAKNFGVPETTIDVAERAYLASQRRLLLRIHPTVPPNSVDSPAANGLLSLFTGENEPEEQEFIDSLTRLASEADSDLARTARRLVESQVGLRDVMRHPIDSNARVINLRLPKLNKELPDLPDLEDENSTDPSQQQATDEQASLDHHTARVMQITREMSSAVPDFAASLTASARWHDAGKLDPRFQFCLADGKSYSQLLAKSLRIISKPRRQQLAQQSGLPAGFRHEMLSTQITAGLLGDTADTDLVLHLIASHHGHAKPFAPVVVDEDPPEVEGNLLGSQLAFDSSARAGSLPHALDSGIAERFWRLTRQFGWWGLAYLESILRLSDWYASAKPGQPETPQLMAVSGRVHIPTASGQELFLRGIDGGNLLGFLAALGALRVCTEQLSLECTLSWREAGSAYRAVFHSAAPITQEEFIDRLTRALACGVDQHPVLEWELWSGKSPAPCRDEFDAARQKAKSTSRAKADFLAAIGSDLSRRVPFDSPLRAPREDYLLGNLRAILGVGRPHAELTATLSAPLCAALFQPWTYSDALENCSLKFDPAEDLRYALRWANPSGDPLRKKRGNMLGANRLAIEAIPLFVSITRSTDFATVGCRRGNDGWTVTWPLWRPPIGLDTIRSLLASPLPADEGDRRRKMQRGIAAVYQCRRETIGKTRIFTPAQPLITSASAGVVKGGAGDARVL